MRAAMGSRSRHKVAHAPMSRMGGWSQSVLVDEEVRAPSSRKFDDGGGLHEVEAGRVFGGEGHGVGRRGEGGDKRRDINACDGSPVGGAPS